MNQRLRQNSQNKIEKDFYKLLNNFNYGHNCRSNLDNFRFEPIYDEIKEITYLRKYHSLFDPKISKFVNSSLIESEIQNRYIEELFEIRNDDPFRIAKISALKEKEKEEKEALSMFKEKEKRNKKKKTIESYMNRVKGAHKNIKIKTLIDFDASLTTSIKSLAVKKQTKVEVKTRFANGTKLMFSKIFLKSFVYDMVDVFHFSDNRVK